MRSQFLPQHQTQQPQQIIGGDTLGSENNLISSSTGLPQTSVAINLSRQHITVDTSTVRYDSYSQQRSQVEMYKIVTCGCTILCMLLLMYKLHWYCYELLSYV